MADTSRSTRRCRTRWAWSSSAVAAGARVIATAGSPEKLDVASRLGADVAIDYRSGDFADAVFDATDGRGVDVCFDGVGGEVTMR